jgi:hypothetical protein
MPKSPEPPTEPDLGDADETSPRRRPPVALRSPWPAIRVEFEVLARRCRTAAELAEPDDADGGMADGIASMLVLLADIAGVARTRLELRALMHAAMGHAVDAELAARMKAKIDAASKR